MEPPKSINAADIANMNSKILVCHKLRQLGVTYDEYRRGLWYSAYHQHILTGRAIAGIKLDISPGDFYSFPLENLIMYTFNRSDPSARTFSYYHPKHREVLAFHHYIQKHLLSDIKRVIPPENDTVRVVPEFFLEYTKIYRKHH